MTETQIKKIQLLQKCTFLPGSYQKRFVHSMGSIAVLRPEMEITEKQDKYLHDLFHQYRKQIGREHARLCDCKEAKQLQAERELLKDIPA